MRKEIVFGAEQHKHLESTSIMYVKIVIKIMKMKWLKNLIKI